jgi:hypothetical protein
MLSATNNTHNYSVVNRPLDIVHNISHISTEVLLLLTEYIETKTARSFVTKYIAYIQATC